MKLKSTITVYLHILLLLRGCFTFQSERPCRLLVTKRSFDRSADGIRLWPNGRIPFTLDSNCRDTDHEAFNLAIEEYHEKTCLRFEPKTEDDKDHIHIKMDYSSNAYCGQAHLCLQEIGAQIIDISPQCSWVSNFIHELGHSVCMDHEHVRPDRIEYLDHSKCSDPSQIQRIEDRLTTRGHIYDYHSQLHYPCYDCVGHPIKEGAKNCGSDANPDSLSVVDADKLNTFYNCQGCKGHRWYRVDTLTSDEQSTLVNFAMDPDQLPTYLCRGFAKGAIAAGTYNFADKFCKVVASKTVNIVTKDVQLFGVTNGPGTISNTTTSGYHLKSPFSVGDNGFVPVGRDVDNEILYAAVTQVNDNGKMSTVLGYIVAKYPRGGWFSHWTDGQYPMSAGTPERPKFFILSCL